jgi:hypothetical protein
MRCASRLLDNVGAGLVCLLPHRQDHRPLCPAADRVFTHALADCGSHYSA